jgi:hypothetical protein
LRRITSLTPLSYPVVWNFWSIFKINLWEINIVIRLI